MKIEFRDKRLALIRTDRAHELGLPIGVIKACRERLVFIEAAPDERSLRNWRSLQYKKIQGSEEHQIRINDQYRIRFLLDKDSKPPVIIITEIGDTH